jgi:large subunit ribosomal protein L6
MSRIGLKPITIPENVTVSSEPTVLRIKGPLGELEVPVYKDIQVTVSDKTLKVARLTDSKIARSLHGLERALIANAVSGVTKGFEKRLEILGIGYRAEIAGDDLKLFLGFSHPVNYKAPEGIKITVEKNQIVIFGIDKQKVGQVAAEIRALKKPEPYKGKGIRYVGEVVYIKPGKAAKAVGASGAAA